MGVSIRCLFVVATLMGCGRSELGVSSPQVLGGEPSGGEAMASGGVVAFSGGVTSGGALPMTGGVEPQCALPCGQCPGDGELTHEGPVGVGSGQGVEPIAAKDLRRIREIHGLLAMSIYPGDEDSLAALGCLERVEGRVSITVVTAAVKDLSWLGSLREVTEDFAISGLTVEAWLQQGGAGEPATGLRSLAGLRLETVGFLGIRNLPALESLAGLERLFAVGGLTVTGNSSLSSLQGLDGLAVAPLGIHVVGNPRLPYCELQSLSVRLGRACTCEGLELEDGRPCSCVDGCKCTGNDNDSPLCD